MTFEELKQQLYELQIQLGEYTNQYIPPKFEIKHYIAEEGFTFQRIQDGMLMGNELYLGYDYSLGFKRIDHIEFYTQIPDPELKEEN